LTRQVIWLLDERNTTPGDALCGRIDPSKVVLCGHSAGAAVAVESVCLLQKRVSALLLLDVVPWQRTVEAAAAADSFLKTIPICSLRAPPDTFNAHSLGLHLLAKLNQDKLHDVVLKNAKHGDFASLATNGGVKAFLLKTLGVIAKDESAQPECIELCAQFLQAFKENDLASFDMFCNSNEDRLGVRKEPIDVAALPKANSFY